jgi:hypothetical protein
MLNTLCVLVFEDGPVFGNCRTVSVARYLGDITVDVASGPSPQVTSSAAPNFDTDKPSWRPGIAANTRV